ncbi:MAG: hypothetical protein V2I67_02430 [Thermoanaerobaculales bacterium]|nr:hypothetical protein [Thermoanaerobaculales bacterium]
MKKSWWAMMFTVAILGMVTACASTNTGRPDPAPGSTEEEPPVNTLKWTTASEVDNFGFDIYRGMTEDGPFERITAEPIPGAGTTDEPQKYVFVDSEIDPTRDYYYFIESISLGGVRERFSPIIRSPAKRSTAVND